MPLKRIKKIATKSLVLLRGSSKKDKEKIRAQYKKLLDYSNLLRQYRQKIKIQYQRNKQYAKKLKDSEKRYSSLLLDYLLLTSSKNPYYSITAGNKELESKWKKASPGKRILFVSPHDCAGSFMRWALAISRHSDYAVRLLTFEMHPYGYEGDLVFPAINTDNWHRLLPLFYEADVIHLKDEAHLFSVFKSKDKALKQEKKLSSDAKLMDFLFQDKVIANKPKIFTHHGSHARRLRSDKRYRDFVRGFKARVAMTPELNYDWFDGYFVPQAIDTDRFKYSWKDGGIITHSPSKPEKKGTHGFLEALEDAAFTDWNLDLIQGVSHKECITRKQEATIFFDQAGKIVSGEKEIVIGFYGNSALEAMVHGIPTIAHISDEAFEGAKRAGKDWSQCPVLNPLPNDADSMKEVIKSFSKMSHSERAKLSKKTREWTEKHHSFQSTAKELAKIYDGLVK